MNKPSISLDNLRVASPCHASWEKMQGSDTSRFCADCKLNVYNISAMTKADAEAFLAKAEGRVCVRYYRRADGTIMTADCPVGVQAARMRFTRRVRSMTAAALAFVAGGVGANSAFAGGGEKMGKIAPIEIEVDRSTTPPADTSGSDQSVAPNGDKSALDTTRISAEPQPPADMGQYIMGGMPAEYMEQPTPLAPLEQQPVNESPVEQNVPDTTAMPEISVATVCGPSRDQLFLGDVEATAISTVMCNGPFQISGTVEVQVDQVVEDVNVTIDVAHGDVIFDGPVQTSDITDVNRSPIIEDVNTISNDEVVITVDEPEIEEPETQITPEVVMPEATLPPSRIE